MIVNGLGLEERKRGADDCGVHVRVLAREIRDKSPMVD